MNEPYLNFFRAEQSEPTPLYTLSHTTPYWNATYETNLIQPQNPHPRPDPHPHPRIQTQLNGSPNPTSPPPRPAQRGQTRHHQTTEPAIRCWEHGCEGRKFSSVGNYRRHLREKNGQAKLHPCPDCGRVFTRSTARNFHRESGTCGLGLKVNMQIQSQIQSQIHQLHQMDGQAYSSGSMFSDSLLDWTPELYSTSSVTPGVFLLGR